MLGQVSQKMEPEKREEGGGTFHKVQDQEEN